MYTILKPTTFKYKFPSLKSFAKKTSKVVNKNINNFADWIISFVPKPAWKVVNERVELLKDEIKDIYKKNSKPAPRKCKTGLKGFLKTYRIDGKNNHDFIVFLNNISQSVIDTILTCEFVKENIENNEEYNFGYFQTKTELITESTVLNELFNIAIGLFSEQISNLQIKVLGGYLIKLNTLIFILIQTNPLKGSSYFSLPTFLINKNAIINVESEYDNEYFKWSVTSAVYPAHRQSSTSYKKYDREFNIKFDWTGIEFTVSLKQIDKFEKQNPFAINVFGYEQNVYSLRISKKENVPIIRLLLLSNGDNKPLLLD